MGRDANIFDFEEERDKREEWIVSATDTSGHTAKAWFRFVPKMSRLIEEVVQGGKYPYRVKGDLFRHAVHRHMEWLRRRDKDPEIERQMRLIKAEEEILREEERITEMMAMMNRLESIVRSRPEDAPRVVLRYYRSVSPNLDGYLEKRFVEEMMARFGSILSPKQRRTLQLTSLEDREED